MFRRVVFDVKPELETDRVEIAVAFESPVAFSARRQGDQRAILNFPLAPTGVKFVP
jgi:hypothetical protein